MYTASLTPAVRRLGPVSRAAEHDEGRLAGEVFATMRAGLGLVTWFGGLDDEDEETAA